MAPNSRFAVAIHCVTALAYAEDEAMTSEVLARSINTNPVVVRRILSALVKAKLVTARQGKAGGSRLSRKPDQITLLDIYRAVESEGLFGMHEKPENKSCPVACAMKGLLSAVFKDAENSLEDSLKKTRLSDLVRKL